MTPEEILKKYELKVTYARIRVLELFQNHPFALSHPFLEKNIDTIDRVTLYRTLNTFEHEGIIHKVLDDSCTLKYALCIDFCKHHDKKHKHEHLHFQCIKCNQTTCLQFQIPYIEVPEGYEIIDTHFSVKGVCKKCNQILSHPNS